MYVPQITELAGYTLRVSEMLTVFEEVQQGKYEVTQVTEEKKDESGLEYFLSHHNLSGL